MMWKFLVLLFLASILIESGKCQNTTERSNEATETASSNEDTTAETVTSTQAPKCDDAIAKYFQANIKHSAEFLLESTDLIPSKAVQLSGALVSYSLALPFFKASGKTAEDFSSYYNLTDADDLRCVLIELARRSKNWPIDVRTLIAADNKYKFSNDSIEITKKILGHAKLLTVEFGNLKSSGDIINNKLNNNIQVNFTDLVTSADLKKRKQELAIFQSISIKLQLEYDYGIPKTEKRYFNIAQNQKNKIDFTVITTTVKYYRSKSLKAELVRVPVKYGFVITFIKAFEDYQEKKVLEIFVKNSELFLTETAKCVNTNVTIIIPSKYFYETKSDIYQILTKRKLVPRIFDAKKAQFDGLVSDNKPIAVTSILQRSVINSSITIKQKYATNLEKKKPVEFLLNYPHIFVISAGDFVLNVGYFGGPQTINV